MWLRSGPPCTQMCVCVCVCVRVCVCMYVCVHSTGMSAIEHLHVTSQLYNYHYTFHLFFPSVWQRVVCRFYTDLRNTSSLELILVVSHLSLWHRIIQWICQLHHEYCNNFSTAAIELQYCFCHTEVHRRLFL